MAPLLIQPGPTRDDWTARGYDIVMDYTFPYTTSTSIQRIPVPPGVARITGIAGLDTDDKKILAFQSGWAQVEGWSHSVNNIQRREMATVLMQAALSDPTADNPQGGIRFVTGFDPQTGQLQYGTITQQQAQEEIMRIGSPRGASNDPWNAARWGEVYRSGKERLDGAAERLGYVSQVEQQRIMAEAGGVQGRIQQRQSQQWFNQIFYGGTFPDSQLGSNPFSGGLAMNPFGGSGFGNPFGDGFNTNPFGTGFGNPFGGFAPYSNNPFQLMGC